ncbi:MAG: hypothetical protein JSV22_05220, partial [Bacteroidales bacterium]
MIAYTLVIALLITVSFKNDEKPVEIIQKTIDNIDTIITLYYKQDMVRTNPRNVSDTIYRFREIYFKRLIQDSIVGVKGHWYMYVDDKIDVIYEDIYDGEKLIRKNNRDSTARIYDLVKYPEFRDKHFWGHNTPYSMQYMFKNILDNKEYYKIKRLNDTIYQDTGCFQIIIRLENKGSMPGYTYNLQDEEGNISITKIFINKVNYYPVRMIMENRSNNNPEQVFFTDQTYYDLKFNLKIDTIKEFNTSIDVL